jgi:Rieske Fe-S protein
MDEHEQACDQQPGLSRRTMVAGTGLLAVVAAAAACSNAQSPAPAPAPQAPPPAGPPAQAAAGQRLGSAGAIPVGGGTVFPDKKVVVTQPTPGSYQAFSAICTHEGCTVNKVADGTIDCPCHGSKFAITNGAPVHGPATRPLSSRQVKVEGDSIVLA